MPRGRNAPNDWPAEPVSVMSMVPSGSPAPPYRRVTSAPSMVPTVRLTLRTGTSNRTGCPLLERVGGPGDELVVEGLHQAVVLHRRTPARGALRQVGHVQDRREVEAVRLPVLDRAAGVEHLGLPDRLVQAAEAQRRQVLADLLGDVGEERLDELRLAGELLAQLGVLGRDADRAGVEVADPHHDAAADDQRRGREAVLLGAEQRGDDHVAAGLELAVGLHDDAVAQPVEQQRLLGLGEAELPRRTGVLEAR